LEKRTFLITGCAGFIGFHACRQLAIFGHTIIGIDNLDDNYSVKLKKSRLEILLANENFQFAKIDVGDFTKLSELFERQSIDSVIHLAARVGVRSKPSEFNKYVQSNLVGFCNVIECARRYETDHFIYASSSSVYGDSSDPPYQIGNETSNPKSLYAATKKSNELIAHSYSHQFGLCTSGLRFFTVYGPWGRPDMAVYGFTEKILSGGIINVFGTGDLERDFTYIEDVTHALVKISTSNQLINESQGPTNPFNLFNIGGGRPVTVSNLILLLEREIDKKANVKYSKIPSADSKITQANTDCLESITGPIKWTKLESGVKKFIEWYTKYHQIGDQ